MNLNTTTKYIWEWVANAHVPPAPGAPPPSPLALAPRLPHPFPWPRAWWFRLSQTTMCENLDMPGSTLRTPDPKVLPGMARLLQMAVWPEQNLSARVAAPTLGVGATYPLAS